MLMMIAMDLHKQLPCWPNLQLLGKLKKPCYTGYVVADGTLYHASIAISDGQIFQHTLQWYRKMILLHRPHHIIFRNHTYNCCLWSRESTWIIEFTAAIITNIVIQL